MVRIFVDFAQWNLAHPNVSPALYKLHVLFFITCVYWEGKVLLPSGWYKYTLLLFVE
jgi:hypothetical protein